MRKNDTTNYYNINHEYVTIRYMKMENKIIGLKRVREKLGHRYEKSIEDMKESNIVKQLGHAKSLCAMRERTVTQ